LNDQRRWIGEKVLHGPVDFLLVADPLIGAAECCCDLINPLRHDFRICRQDGLLAQQFHLLLNPCELRIEKGELFDRFAFFLLSLLQDFDLCRQALFQVFGDRRLLKLFLQFIDAVFHLRRVIRWTRRLANDFSNRLTREQETQINPSQPAQAGTFRVTVTNLAGLVNSVSVTLTVLPDAGKAGTAKAIRCANATCAVAGTADGALALWRFADGTWSRVGGLPSIRVGDADRVAAPLDVDGTLTAVVADGGQVKVVEVGEAPSTHTAAGPTGAVTAAVRVGPSVFVVAGGALWRADVAALH